MTCSTTVLRLAALSFLTAGAAHAALVGSLAFDNVPVGATISNPAANDDGWLHVNLEALTFEAAVTNLEVLNSGWGNLAPDTVMDFRFAGHRPVPNLPGADVLILDARFDAGSYILSVDFDGFTQEFVVGSDSFADTGESRDYYFGRNTLPPSSASIFVAAVDFSSLNVPDDATVQAVRLRTIDERSDLLGVVAFVPEPSSLSLSALALLALVTRRRRDAS